MERLVPNGNVDESVTSGHVRDHRESTGSLSLVPVVRVPVNAVKMNEALPGTYRTHSPESVSELADRIAAFGWMISPIALDRDMNLIFGLRRLAAARLLGWQEIEARIWIDLNDPELLEIMRFEENRDNGNLTLEEMLEFKRHTWDPNFDKHRLQVQRENANRLNQARSVDAAGSLPVPGESIPATREAGNLPASATTDEAGRFPASVLPPGTTGYSRDLIGKYLPVSGKTLESFEKIVEMSEDDAYPEELRERLHSVRRQTNESMNVTRGLKKAKQLLDEHAAATLQRHAKTSSPEFDDRYNAVQTVKGPLELLEQLSKRLLECDVAAIKQAVSTYPTVATSWRNAHDFLDDITTFVRSVG